jgi:hypothetical protein
MVTHHRAVYVVTVSTILLALLLPFAADSQNPPEPLSKEQIIGLLKDVPSHRVARIAREKGVAFDLTPDVETELRHARATEELLKTLRELAPRAPELEVESTPGNAQVYVDDRLTSSTSTDGRVIIPGLKPGEHKIRVSLQGYKDYEQSVTLEAGRTASVTATLTPRVSPRLPVLESPNVLGPAPDIRGNLPNLASEPQVNPSRPTAVTICSGTFPVRAGGHVYWTLNITPVMQNARLIGSFQASGGSGNDIQAIVASQTDFQNWINGHPAQALYSTPKVTSGNIDIRVPPGTYILGFSNRFSALSNKQVSVSVKLFFY